MVTGGNGGIGLAMADALAQAGANIAIAARNAEKGVAAVAQLAAHGVEAAFIPVDVTDTASIEAAVAASADRFGGLDILINNAGTNVRKRPEILSLDEWRLVIDTNLTSAFVASKAAHGPMLAAGGGKIINIGSMLSLFGASFSTAYGASKGGIVQMTRSMATAWADDNIQINAVLPGWIDTDLTRQARKDVDGLHQRVLNRTPAGRWGKPEDHAGIAIFLASSASDFVTGAAIPIDGGFSIQI
jgi:2-deoxy-D-gluconate 3-dehydrogenase